MVAISQITPAQQPTCDQVRASFLPGLKPINDGFKTFKALEKRMMRTPFDRKAKRHHDPVEFCRRARAAADHADALAQTIRTTLKTWDASLESACTPAEHAAGNEVSEILTETADHLTHEAAEFRDIAREIGCQ